MNNEVSIWYEDGGKEWIEEYIHSLFLMIKEGSSSKGVYAVKVDDIFAYIGESGHGKRTIEQRLCEHAYHLSINPKCYFGIPSSEIIAKKAKLFVEVLALESNPVERKDFETKLIEKHNPYTQSMQYRKYSKDGYEGRDLCIYRIYRHDAYLVARGNE